MADEDKFLQMLGSDKDLAYDVETNGLRWQERYVCGYSLSDGVDSVYVAVRHEPGGNISQVGRFEAEVNKRIKERRKKLIGHNIKFDKHFSLNHGIDLGPNITDTMVNAALLNEWKRSYSLESCCAEHPDIPQKKSEEIKNYIVKNISEATYKEAMGSFYKLHGQDQMASEYARVDTLSTYHLYKIQEKELYRQELDVVVGVENNLISTLQRMERRGVKVNTEAASRLKEKIENLRYEAYKQIPMTEDLDVINIKSSKDLKKYFEYLNIQDWPVTEKGNPSFNQKYLETVDAGEVILHARKLDTFLQLFLTPLPENLYHGRVHTNFNQTAGEFGGTKTGRLSSYSPNMQQIPKRDKFIGKEFRSIFTADPDYLLVEYDYSQIEPRLFSHYSGEPSLLRGYQENPPIDMHSIACEMMGIYEKFPGDRSAARQFAKGLNLGMQYGMGSKKLAVQLGISEDEAYKITRQWYKAFPNVSRFTKDAAERAEQRGYVKTILGRRARFDDLRFSYRAANRIVQGGAADILKWKLVEVDRWIEDNDFGKKVQLLLTIHDSVLLQVRKDSLALLGDIKHILERLQAPPFNTRIPFTVDAHEPADNWSKATYGQ